MRSEGIDGALSTRFGVLDMDGRGGCRNGHGAKHKTRGMRKDALTNTNHAQQGGNLPLKRFGGNKFDQPLLWRAKY